MFKRLAKLILRNRYLLLIIIFIITAFMGWQATHIQLSYEFAKILPASDPDYQAYQQFKEKFGEDGSVMFIGIQDSSMQQLNKYNAWWKLGEDIRKLDGIEAVVSTARLYCLQRNDSLQKFEMKLLKDDPAANQLELDSIQNVISDLPFYDGFILNKESHASLMAITFDKVKLNTKNRIEIVRNIKAKAMEFSKVNGVDVHLSGMPYIRTEITSKVVQEMKLFMILAVLVTALVLFVFFRSFQVVFFSLIVVAVGVIWSLGTIALLGYKITILSGLIPPLIIVIGIPNSILLLNKYQTEYARHNSQGVALSRMVQRIGLTTFLANVTTAIGFFVLYFTESRLLMEFGLVAAANVMSTWLISLILIPIVFSFLSPPDVKHVKHLEAPRMQKLLTYVNSWVRFHTKKVYAVVIVITIISLYGMTKLDNVGYVVDDLPKNDPVYVDMKFFESNFKGVLPLEFSVSLKDSSNILEPKTLQKINRLEKELAKMPELSKPISVVDGIKYSYQSYQGGEKKYYILPGSMQLAEMSSYMGDQKGKSAMFKSFLDSNKTETRISVQMSDIGSKKMDVLLAHIRPKVDSIFPSEEYNTKITGNSLIFLKGNKYLFENLVESILLAIFLISIIMITLFMSFRMILISILPSLIPLIITAGLMGFFHIALKPSTILIFSIAFGIASDQTIYFLTKYRHEMRNSKIKSISKAVTDTIFESGLSMIYTAVILFFGFFIFSASGFGGTAALGKLLSTTLLMAMISNLILLPAFLVSLERRLTTKAFLSEPLFEIDGEDDDIDHDELEIQKNDLA
jgi:predicted RND superfamily exporter protein